MNRNMLYLTIGVLAVALLACITVASPALAQEVWRDLATFFGGHLRAEGQFKNYYDGSTRGMRVDLYGKPKGRTFEIVTNLSYSDGEKQRKVWRFQRISEGRYVGHRADLVGKATVVVVGNRIDITYVARVRIKGGRVRNLRFKESFMFTQPGRGSHWIRVSLMSVPVGEARLVVRKLSR